MPNCRSWRATYTSPTNPLLFRDFIGPDDRLDAIRLAEDAREDTERLLSVTALDQLEPLRLAHR